MQQGAVLVVESDGSVARGIQAALEAAGHHVWVVASAGEALAEAERREWEVGVVGVARADGLELISALRARRPHLSIVAVTREGTGASGPAARAAGAHVYVESPGDLVPDRLRMMVDQALERARLSARVAALSAGGPGSRTVGAGEAPPSPPTLRLDALEREAILRALVSTRWNKQAAAALLGLHRPTLYSKMRKHGIPLKRPA
jgi:DNA-binding NtrC family response regulator